MGDFVLRQSALRSTVGWVWVSKGSICIKNPRLSFEFRVKKIVAGWVILFYLIVDGGWWLGMGDFKFVLGL